MKTDRLPCRGILFDFDGTLMDTIPLILESYHHSYAALGLRKHSDAEIIAGIGLTLEKVFASEYPEHKAELLKIYLDFNHRVLNNRVAIYRGIIPMLRALRAAGFPLGIVTAKRKDGLTPTLDLFELEQYFDAIITKFDTVEHKPHPAPLLLGMQKLGIDNPAECLYVGDAVYDLQAAHNAGMPAVAVAWSATPRATLAAEGVDLWIEDPLHFVDQLQLLA